MIQINKWLFKKKKRLFRSQLYQETHNKIALQNI